MTGSQIVLGALGAVTLAAFWAFALVSYREGEARAWRIAAVLGVICSLPWIAVALAPPAAAPWGAGVAAIAVVAIALAWVVPIGRGVALGGRGSMRVDERDTMFARGRLRPGSDEYRAYYALRPQNQAGDDKTRSLPGFLTPGTELADPIAFAAARGSFAITEALRGEWNTPVAAQPVERRPEQWVAVVKDLARYLGANSVGVARLDAAHVYSHVGRGVGRWGDPVEPTHRWAIAFAVEMRHQAVARAPGAATVMESARRYVDITTIGLHLAEAIRDWGFEARAHTDGNYRVIAPLVARDAGLGEIGRMGLLMTPRLGPRVRLGVVTTDLPLVADPPGDDRSVLDFCSICKKCAENCPVGAIPHAERETVGHDGLRWRVNSEACFRYWAVVGTDCATCMRVCPYSHPDNPAHGLVRWAIRHSGAARRALLWMDDLVYGRRPRPRPPSTTGIP